jgi:hypothetical protein
VSDDDEDDDLDLLSCFATFLPFNFEESILLLGGLFEFDLDLSLKSVLLGGLAEFDHDLFLILILDIFSVLSLLGLAEEDVDLSLVLFLEFER